MINMLLYKVGQDPEVVEIAGGVKEMEEVIGAEYTIASTRIQVTADAFTQEEYKRILADDGWLPYGNISGKLVAWADDEGILLNKPYNRGLYGNFLVCKVDTEGFDVRMSDEEIKRVIEFFDSVGKTKEHVNKRVEEFFCALERRLSPNPSNYQFEDEEMGTYLISVSVKEVINDLRGCTDPELNDQLDDLAFGFFSGQLSIEEAEAIFDDLKFQLAEQRFKSR